MKSKALSKVKSHDVFHGPKQGVGKAFLSMGVTIFLHKFYFTVCMIQSGFLL